MSAQAPSGSGAAAARRGARSTDCPERLAAAAAAAALLLLLLAALTDQAFAQEQPLANMVESRAPLNQDGEFDALNDLDKLEKLEKLDKLDKYWSEVARPRWGRSEYKQRAGIESAQLARLQQQQQRQQQRHAQEAPLVELLLSTMLARRPPGVQARF